MSKQIQNISKKDFIVINQKSEKVKLKPLEMEWILDDEATRLLGIFPKELKEIQSKPEEQKNSKKDKKKNKKISDLVKQAEELGIEGAENLTEGEILNLIQEKEAQ